jgi:hypothetical protein
LQPATLRARTEQGSPETDHRRTSSDGLFEITRHTHRKLFKTELVAEIRDLVEGGPSQSRISGRCNCHQAFDTTPYVLEPYDQLRDLLWTAAASSRQTGGVDLYEH